MSAPDPFGFLEAVESFGADRAKRTALATVTSVTSAGALVRFDGESAAGAKRYRCVKPAPVVGDRVLMIRTGSSWVVVGALA